MTCSCGSVRFMEVFAKHSDLANMEIPHLELKHDGYMPPLGPFGGDDFDIHICMECGKIQNWKPITDTEVFEAFNVEEDEIPEDADEEDVPRSKERGADKAATAREPASFSMIDVEKQRILQLLRFGYGEQWWKDDEAIEILQGEVANTLPSNATTRVVCMAMLKQLNK